MCLRECVFGFGTVFVRLTVQAFTVVLSEHREGDFVQIKVKTNKIKGLLGSC